MGSADRITDYLAGGICALGLGAVVVTWVLLDAGGSATSTSGHVAGVVLGAATIVAGLVCLFIGGAAHGARLALAARDEARAAEAARVPTTTD